MTILGRRAKEKEEEKKEERGEEKKERHAPPGGVMLRCQHGAPEEGRDHRGGDGPARRPGAHAQAHPGATFSGGAHRRSGPLGEGHAHEDHHGVVDGRGDHDP
jgi:hypothetical protein